MQEQITIKGVSLHVFRAGNDPLKPTILFLHDSLGCVALWRDFPARLATRTGCNILIWDRQGYGLSAPFDPEQQRGKDYLEREADLLPLLLQQCAVGDAILFGHSDGGSIALIAAAKHPELFRAVITEGAHIFVEDISLEGIRAAVAAYDATDLKHRLQKYHGDKTDAVFAAWTKTWLRPDFRDWNIESLLPCIQCPVLVIQGATDEYGSIAQVEGIVHAVAGKAEVFMPPAVGHTPHKEAAADVLDVAATFIARYF